MDRVLKKWASFSFLVCLVGCGTSTESFGGDSSGNPKKCGDVPETAISVNGDDVQVNMGRSPYSGTVEISAVSSELIQQPFEDPYGPEMIDPQGQFVGIRLEFKNNLDSSFQPSSVVLDNMQVTDGTQSWSIADYNGVHDMDAPSWAWSENQGDESGATEVGAGFTLFTWALFDVPTDANPTAIAYQSEGRQYCLAIPTRP